MTFENKRDEIGYAFHSLNTDLTILLETLKSFSEERARAVARLQEVADRLDRQEAVAQLRDVRERIDKGIKELEGEDYQNQTTHHE